MADLLFYGPRGAPNVTFPRRRALRLPAHSPRHVRLCRLSHLAGAGYLGQAGGSYVGRGYLRILHCSGATCGAIKDLDIDGDLLPDRFEAGGELCWCPDLTDPDSDDDFLTDGVEAYIGSNLCAPDTDRDGLTDGAEIYVSALRGGPCPSLLDRDSDGDGWTDGQERYLGTNYCSRPSHPSLASTAMPSLAASAVAVVGEPDTDGDMLPDSFEAALRQCPSSEDPDSDDDLLWDGVEVYIGSNVCANDTDRDGMTDGLELYLSIARGGSCPSLMDRDSDGDGWRDGQERSRGTNYCSRLSHP